MKKILLIGTGGTIASEPSGCGLRPGLTTSQLLDHIKGLDSICDTDSIQLFALDSTNITPAHWQEMVRCIHRNYDLYDGFVITHGTDTLAYTAAALSYMIQGSPKPIILTGAQMPIIYDSTDSKINLKDAFICASCSDCDFPGVSIVFNGKIILGTRAKKTHSKSFGAFSSINYPDLGVMRGSVPVRFIRQSCAEAPTFYEELDTYVALAKLVPGAGREMLDFLFDRNDAVIIESFGVGGVPDAGGFYDCIKTWTERGKIAVLTTQVEKEGSDLDVYNVGHRLKNDLGVPEAYDMTTEAVLAKLMWILAHTKNPESVRKMFYTPVAMDMLQA